MYTGNSAERLKTTDSMMDMLMKMADGNPGAATALVELTKSDIDDDNIFGFVGVIMQLDSYGIYGTDIYILWSDICKRSIVRFQAVLRACQLGLFPPHILIDAAHRQDGSGAAMIPVEELYAKVKEQLPNFNPENRP